MIDSHGVSGSSGLDKKRILILAGTTEARQLAERLTGRSDLSLNLSLAGRTENPASLAAPTRTGGFGGVDGLVAYLRDEQIDLLIDATHPFAARMSKNAIEASTETGVPLLRLERPGWQPEPGDHWTSASSISDAVNALGSAPRRVFLAIGRQEANAFSAAPQHHYLVRSIDPVDPPLDVPNVEYLLARGPFSVEAEETLLRQHRINVIVSKNSGGSATQGKLFAARKLGIEVVMVERAQNVAPHRAYTVDDALPLINHLLASVTKRGV